MSFALMEEQIISSGEQTLDDQRVTLPLIGMATHAMSKAVMCGLSITDLPLVSL